MEDLQWLYDTSPVPLNKKQKDFLYHFIVENKGHGCLSGLAGSGKSAVMGVLKTYYGDSIIHLASTGVANLNLPNGIGCGTCYSALSLPNKMATELTYKRVSKKCRELFASSSLVTTIVIDEAYALNSDVLDVIWRRIERFNKKTRKREKRNIRLLLVGDSAQMVTIADKEKRAALADRWGSHLMFRSTVWERFNFTHYVFDEVMRQTDHIYKACLDVIRYNQKHRFPKALSWLNKRYTQAPKDALVLASTNKEVDRINNEVLQRNPNPKHHFPVNIKGKFDMKDVLIREDGVTLCEGLRVMAVKNHTDGLWVNGSCGTITFIESGTGAHVLFDDGSEQLVEYDRWENKETYVEVDVAQEDGSLKDELKERTLGSLEAMPLISAAAMSISKSQGLSISYDFIIDIGNSNLFTWEKLDRFGENFLYVATTRAVSVNNMYLARPIEPDHIKVCEESIKFWFECCELSVI